MIQRRELLLDLLVESRFGDDGQDLGATTESKGYHSLDQENGQLRLQLRKGPQTVAR